AYSWRTPAPTRARPSAAGSRGRSTPSVGAWAGNARSCTSTDECSAARAASVSRKRSTSASADSTPPPQRLATQHASLSTSPVSGGGSVNPQGWPAAEPPPQGLATASAPIRLPSPPLTVATRAQPARLASQDASLPQALRERLHGSAAPARRPI